MGNISNQERVAVSECMSKARAKNVSVGLGLIEFPVGRTR
jgi:hypothetical protein